MPFISSVRKAFGPQGKKNTPWRKYLFSSHTFTNAGLNGRIGPTQAQMQAAYSSVSWAQDQTNLSNLNGIQVWTVPQSGYYRIECAGASGGTNGSNSVGGGGQGYRNSGVFYLSGNTSLRIVVGQHGVGASSGSAAGGGGASYVYNPLNNSTPLILAAGGGGHGYTGASNSAYNAVSGPLPASHPAGTQSTQGNGGVAGCCGDGGAGWNAIGQNATEGSGRLTVYFGEILKSDSPTGGQKDKSGGGGVYTFGGFGGGAGGSGNSGYGGGGAGYTGGTGGQCCSGSNEGGGGGGSYIHSSALSPTNYGNTTSPYVTITRV